ncbi:MAG: DNA-binding response regulator [Chloroflexi bacterium]|nr:MAG: DNA-binding response regulator [Chloroflexota bacterium]
MPKNRLLIIEDDYDVAEMLVMYFTSYQFEVFHADTGLDGIEMARSNFPNLILLDVMMPEMDGYEVCIKLRQMTFTKYIPIIFLTQRDNRANKVKGLELGADDYITKPFDVDELRLRVKGAIERATRESLHEPRTGLPTGPLVAEEIERYRYMLVEEDRAYTQMRVHIEGLVAYRDMYGFMAADDAMAFAARSIQKSMTELGTQDDFVGIVDDEFIVLTHSDDPLKLEKAYKQRFAEGITAFYSFADSSRGGILLEAGTENEKLVPIMSLTTITNTSV